MATEIILSAPNGFKKGNNKCARCKEKERNKGGYCKECQNIRSKERRDRIKADQELYGIF